MKKKITLLTGRAFMCLGIPEDQEDFIKDQFETGEDYLEVKADIDGVNWCTEDDLLLSTKGSIAVYVKKADFALMLDLTDYTTELINKINEQ